MVAGLLEAAALADAHAILADHEATHKDRLGDFIGATASRQAALALRAFAIIVRARANDEVTDEIQICPACVARLAAA